MHPHPVPPSKKVRPWPAYFLVRTTGEVVPLIAVDELPPVTDLIGVPRSLDLEDTIGMLNLGLQRSSGSFYRIVGSGVEGKGRGESCGIGEKVSARKPTSDLQSTTSAPHRTARHSSPVPTTTPPSIPGAQSTHASPISLASHTSPSTIAPTQDLKQTQPLSHTQTPLCRHWCHHGICKWGQQCRYRHTMPMSTSGLQEVELSDWPVWFKRLNPGYFAAETPSGTGSGGRVGPVGSGGGRGRRGVRERVAGCMSAGGNGGACCGVLHGPGGGGGRDRGVREREKARSERVVSSARERCAGAGRILGSEELGAQIIERLRGMSNEYAAKEKAKAKAGDRLSSSSLVERVAARDTKNWEDESSDDGESQSEKGIEKKEEGVKGKEEGGKGKEKLVDV